jgi:hypothetical protein
MKILGCGGEHSVFPKTSFWELDFLGGFVFGVFDTFLGNRGYAIKRQKHCGNSLQCYVAGKRK